MTRLLVLGVLMAADVSAQLNAIWTSLEPKAGDRPVSWSWRLTPAIPAEWPPKSNAAKVVRYAYAAAFDPSLNDAERTAPPFAKVELLPDGSATVTRLGAKLGELEIQGVRPISKGEAELQSGDLVEAARTGQMSSLRVPWCAWKKNHGVIAKHLATQHPAFFEALACETVKGGGGKSK